MAVLARAFLAIALLRMTPQALPASSALLWLTGLLNFSLGVFIGAFDLDIAIAIALLGILTLLEIALLWGLLALMRKHQRMTQTLTALFGTSLILSVPALLLRFLEVQLDAQDPGASWLALSWLGLIIWNLVIIAHIIRHALEVGRLEGFIIAFCYLLVIFQASSYLQSSVFAVGAA